MVAQGALRFHRIAEALAEVVGVALLPVVARLEVQLLEVLEPLE